MSDDSPFPPDKRKTPHPNSIANLLKSKPGDPPLNPTGKNGRSANHLAFLEWLDGKAPNQDATRIDNVRRAVYVSSLVPGLKGAADRKLIIEQYHGKAKQQIDLSSDDGSVAIGSAASAFVEAVLQAAKEKLTKQVVDGQSVDPPKVD